MGQLVHPSKNSTQPIKCFRMLLMLWHGACASAMRPLSHTWAHEHKCYSWPNLVSLLSVCIQTTREKDQVTMKSEQGFKETDRGPNELHNTHREYYSITRHYTTLYSKLNVAIERAPIITYHLCNKDNNIIQKEHRSSRLISI